MSKQVSETADTLRHVEQALATAIKDRESIGDILDAIQAYGDALLAHHKAVEAEQTPPPKFKGYGGIGNPMETRDLGGTPPPEEVKT